MYSVSFDHRSDEWGDESGMDMGGCIVVPGTKHSAFLRHITRHILLLQVGAFMTSINPIERRQTEREMILLLTRSLLPI